MTSRYLATLPMAALLLLATAAAPVTAQTTRAAPVATGAADGLAVKALRELDDDNATVMWNGLTVDQIEDMDIVNAEGDTIGDIEEVLADAEGRIVAVTAEVGGFLGLGDKEVVVSLDHLELQGDRFITALTADQLEASPRWDDD